MHSLRVHATARMDVAVVTRYGPGQQLACVTPKLGTLHVCHYSAASHAQQDVCQMRACALHDAVCGKYWHSGTHGIFEAHQQAGSPVASMLVLAACDGL